MENNKSRLKELCRICGKKVIEKLGYVKAKTCEDYADLLRNHFGILPSEDRMTYPQNLCITCKHRLDKLQKTGADHLNPSAIFQFEPHQDKTCWLCDKPYNVTKSKANKTLHWKNVDKAFTKIGFYRIELTNDSRTYASIFIQSGIPTVRFSINVNHLNFTWSLLALNKKVDKLDHLELPAVLNDDNIDIFCKSISDLSVCQANSDFVDVLKYRVDFKQPFPSHEVGLIAAYAESSIGHISLIKENFDTVRSSNCELLINRDKERSLCNECKKLRKKLELYRTRIPGNEQLQKQSDPSSSTNIRYLKTEALEGRYKAAQSAKWDAFRKLAITSHKLDDILKQEAINPNNLTRSHHEVCKEILQKKMPKFDEDTPQWLLWNQQLEMASKKDKRGMRWHPLIIRWCMSIYATSPAAYRQIASKQNKFMILPHVNTLKKYINFTTPQSGFSADIISKLIEDSKLSELKEHEKNVSLSFDEIKIKSGLVYNRGTGKIVGFTEMGSLNEEVKEFTSQCSAKTSNNDEKAVSDFATYVLVFMVRGIFTSFCSTIGYFASSGMTGDQLYPLVSEATRTLEALSFKVRNWTCDGASPNRKLFNIFSSDDGFYYTVNPFDVDRKIYFISDPPHLMKTLRNNLENSHGNLNSRNLMRNEKQISWCHIIDVYEWDLGMDRSVFGLRMLPKLRDEHIRLTPQHRMSVKYAVQVLSNSMAMALKMQSKTETEETIKFIGLFDKAFDCLNVSRVSSSDKPFRQPYRTADDSRFEFLQSVIQYLDEWEAEIEKVTGVSKVERARLLLSQQTVTGWRITITSFVELAQALLQEADKNTFLLSEKLSQDPLEEHFSRHRRVGGANENPSFAQFQQQEIALHAMQSELIADLRGNTSGRILSRPGPSVGDTRLPRKK